MSYKVEIVVKKNLILQLEASKLNIKNIFGDLLNETKKFWVSDYCKNFVKKYKPNREIEFALVYFNLWTKTVINNRFKLEDSFQEILYMIDAWINEGSGWIFESIESQYINISTYRTLSGSFYIDLPIELNHPRKGLIDIKNKDENAFYGAMLGIIILQKNIQEKFKKLTKKLLKSLITVELSFL